MTLNLRRAKIPRLPRTSTPLYKETQRDNSKQNESIDHNIKKLRQNATTAHHWDQTRSDQMRKSELGHVSKELRVHQELSMETESTDRRSWRDKQKHIIRITMCGCRHQRPTDLIRTGCLVDNLLVDLLIGLRVTLLSIRSLNGLVNGSYVVTQCQGLDCLRDARDRRAPYFATAVPSRRRALRRERHLQMILNLERQKNKKISIRNNDCYVNRSYSDQL